ncbi:hypothetical protein Lbir_2955 [Legionella birminghamensis]|uniref:Uncharacterized protein n=1 Tax=Legionella birminghamensis TaxID=28083 RepID=A0A378I7V7_9GAMM|nr:hypothetical protein Lbir_2955 [Legionella birminghamensis]STX30932.1 Uncharacterised protein [Legionella birminghamensis]
MGPAVGAAGIRILEGLDYANSQPAFARLWPTRHRRGFDQLDFPRLDRVDSEIGFLDILHTQ